MIFILIVRVLITRIMVGIRPFMCVFVHLYPVIFTIVADGTSSTS